jgi:ApaG protein
MGRMDGERSDIDVQVATSYVDEQSQPDADRYVFSYTITIANNGDEPATLKSRHWIITDANGKVQEVTGDGVVGEQPHLNPGERFRYSSGAVLETPVGAMQGLYRMETDEGRCFDAPIPPFTLAVPGSLH